MSYKSLEVFTFIKDRYFVNYLRKIFYYPQYLPIIQVFGHITAHITLIFIQYLVPPHMFRHIDMGF